MRAAEVGRRMGVWAGVAAAIVLCACSEWENPVAQPGGSAPGRPTCSIPTSQIFNGGPGKDGIPALTEPELVAVGASGTEYLRDDDRVIGLALEGEVLAIPLNILWWHEIVNLRVGDRDLAITHCPLTGSSLPTLGVTVAGGRLEATAQIPVSGRNLPAGPGLSLGYRLAWGVDSEPTFIPPALPEPR